MRVYGWLGFTLLIFLPACGSDQPAKTHAPTADDGKHFGATIDAAHAIAYDELIPKMVKSEVP